MPISAANFGPGAPSSETHYYAEADTLPAGNFAEQVKSPMALIATGDLSSTTAAEIASVISIAARVEEIDQLRDELVALRAVLEGRK